MGGNAVKVQGLWIGDTTRFPSHAPDSNGTQTAPSFPIFANNPVLRRLARPEGRVLADCNLYFFRYYVRIAITAVAVSDEFHCFFISVDLLGVGLEVNCASEPIFAR